MARRSYRSSGRRRSYSGARASRAGYSRRRSTRSSGRVRRVSRSSRPQTIRIVVEPVANTMARPDLLPIGKKAADEPKKAKF